MQKVLLISHIFPPATDGGSRVIYQLGQHLSKSQYQTLYLSSDCSSTDDFTKSNKIPCPVKGRVREGFYLPVYHHLRRPFKFINLFLVKKSYLHQFLSVCQKGPVFKLIPFIKTTVQIIKFNPDLIIAGPLPTTIILYANFLKKITNLYNRITNFPSILQGRGLRGGFCHLLINASFHQTDSDFYQQPLIKTLQQADYLWTLTQYESDFFIQKLNINPNKIILAGNGINQNFLIKEKKVTPCPVQVHRYPGESRRVGEGFRILFIGSLSAHKGLNTLINSFSEVYDQYPNISLTIAGQKTLYYPEIIKIIKHQPKAIRKQIKFIFNFPQDQLSKLIDQSNVLVLPSSQESFGLVLIESWARLKPVITSDIPPLKELVTKTHGGLAFTDKDCHDLTQKIIQLIKSPEKCHQLGQNGHNYVKNNYTWFTVTQKICQKISL